MKYNQTRHFLRGCKILYVFVGTRNLRAGVDLLVLRQHIAQAVLIVWNASITKQLFCNSTFLTGTLLILFTVGVRLTLIFWL